MSDPCHLAWLIRDNRFLLFRYDSSHFHGVCSNGTTFSDLNPRQYSNCPYPQQEIPIQRCLVVCPPGQAISPCSCRETKEPLSMGLQANCQSLQIDDSEMSKILEEFLLPGVRPLIELDAGGYSLTKIPRQISKFTQIEKVVLEKNGIGSIPSGAFISQTAEGINLHLNSNQIAAIHSDAFAFPLAMKINIDLGGNQITEITHKIFDFPSVKDIAIEPFRNQIGAIPSNVFSFPLAESVKIQLYSNQISVISSDSFNFSLANEIKIEFFENQITSCHLFRCIQLSFSKRS